MGLMDSIKGLFGGKSAGGGGSADLMGVVTAMFAGSGPLGTKVGGLSGILDKFKSAGMGDKVTSWLTPGTPNQPLSGDEVEQALGSDTVQDVATATGTSAPQAKSGLAGMIPGLVDKLTPDGNIPGADQITGLMKNLDVGKLLGGFGK
jgi:uncharacterized protein YidB (DUF937 family)